jgi:hypothetical protein
LLNERVIQTHEIQVGGRDYGRHRTAVGVERDVDISAGFP